MEIWKEIAGAKGFIEVSNEGRVRSLLRGTPRILKTQVDNKGYHRIRVTIEQIKMSYRVHREVAKAFIDNPSNLPQVNHIDGNKENIIPELPQDSDIDTEYIPDEDEEDLDEPFEDEMPSDEELEKISMGELEGEEI